MKKKIELTPDWVLENVPHLPILDGKGNLSLYTNDAMDANFIEAALYSLKISYKLNDSNGEDSNFHYGFELRIKDLLEDCPNYCHLLKNIYSSGNIYNDSLKN